MVADPQRDDTDAGDCGEAVEERQQGLLEYRCVVDTGADDHLGVDLDAIVEEDVEPPETGRPPGVPQETGPNVGVGGVDGDVERAQALGDDPLGVELGEPRQGGEVPVEEGEPVVIVLEVEALPHPLGQLVDETELAVVVAGADSVEHGRVDSSTQRLAFALQDPHPPVDRRPEPSHEQLEIAAIGHLLPFDHVERFCPIDREHLVADGESRTLGG